MLRRNRGTPSISCKCLAANYSFRMLLIASNFFAFYLLASLAFHPSILLNGRIWAEEAREFLIPLAPSYQAFDFIFYLHKGHVDLFPNIATYFSLVLPIRLAPYIFVWVALIPVACFSMCFGSYLSGFMLLKFGEGAFKKSNLLCFFWISCMGFLAGFCLIGVESHINTINSWSFIVASVALLLPFSQAFNAPLLAGAFIGVSPILAFPCLLFSPWILLQLVFSKSPRIKFQNIIFFISVALQLALPRMLPSSWSFGEGRCLEVRDILAIIPTFVAKNVLPLMGITRGFASQKYSPNALIIISVVFLAVCGIIIYRCLEKTNIRNAFSERFYCGDKVLVRAIVSTSFIIVIWQFSAIPSSLRGAYSQLVLGGGYRYSNSIFLVFLGIVSMGLFSSVISDVNSIRFLDKNDFPGPKKINISQFGIVKLFSIGWLVLMLSVSVLYKYNTMLSGDDFWCFYSRPEWPYQSRPQFMEAIKTPGNILTCPRGWDNEMQGQGKRSFDEKRKWCREIY